MISSIKIGSRGSPLAVSQVKEILSLIAGNGLKPFPTVESIIFSTKGDVDKTTSLTTNPADNFFTDALDEALLKGKIDIAIHSAKDLPKTITAGLKIFALTQGIDDTDSWVSSYAIEELPAGAKIGTSSTLRSAQFKLIRPDITLVDIRGTIEERLEILKQGKVDGLIIATCALKRLGLEKHIHSILPWEAVALQGQLAVVGRASDWDLEKLFAPIDVRLQYGQVLLVGAGPGDPKLITVKAIEALQKADCVFYDYLADPVLLQYAPQAEHIYVGKRKGKHALSQDKLSSQLKDKAMKGKTVVRLKGGDPLIFGRGADEITYLQSYHIDVQVIPGVSSATAIPSLLGVPLTARGMSSSVAFVSAHGESEAINTNDSVNLQIPKADTIVFLMGLTKLSQIVKSLLKIGWDKSKPIMIVSQGTKPSQRIVCGTLADIEKQAFAQVLEAPALIIAGETVKFYKKESDKVYLHCGTHPEKYSQYGQIIPWPMIQIEEVSWSEDEKKKFIKDFDESEFVILTSPNAAEHFMKMALSLKPINALIKKDFIVIGQYTWQILDEFGIEAQIMSAEETAQDLFATMERSINLEGVKILFPRSSLANPFLKESLIKKGAIVKEWTIYNNVKPAKRPLPSALINGIIFTSPSTFKNFLQDYGTIPTSWEILAKGPYTAKSLQEAGYQPHVVGV